MSRKLFIIARRTAAVLLLVLFVLILAYGLLLLSALIALLIHLFLGIPLSHYFRLFRFLGREKNVFALAYVLFAYLLFVSFLGLFALKKRGKLAGVKRLCKHLWGNESVRILREPVQ